MIETIAQGLLALAGINFSIAGASLMVGLGLKHYKASSHELELPVYQDLPQGPY